MGTYFESREAAEKMVENMKKEPTLLAAEKNRMVIKDFSGWSHKTFLEAESGRLFFRCHSLTHLWNLDSETAQKQTGKNAGLKLFRLSKTKSALVYYDEDETAEPKWLLNGFEDNGPDFIFMCEAKTAFGRFFIYLNNQVKAPCVALYTPGSSAVDLFNHFYALLTSDPDAAGGADIEIYG